MTSTEPVSYVSQAGDKLPAVTLYEGDFDTKILLTDLFKGKKVNSTSRGQANHPFHHGDSSA